MNQKNDFEWSKLNNLKYSSFSFETCRIFVVIKIIGHSVEKDMQDPPKMQKRDPIFFKKRLFPES